jgi:hypothetical protein
MEASLQKAIVEQKVVELLAKNQLQTKVSVITDATIIKQIRFYLLSNHLIEKNQELTTNQLLDLLSTKLNGVPLTKDNPFFLDYLKTFWDYNGSHIQERIDAGFAASLTSCEQHLACITCHIEPFFDKNLRLRDITPALLEKHKAWLKENGKKNGIINFAIETMSAALNDAVRLGTRDSNPCLAISKLKKDYRKRGILTQEEVAKLFAHP